jgi:hypothetical protein
MYYKIDLRELKDRSGVRENRRAGKWRRFSHDRHRLTWDKGFRCDPQVSMTGMQESLVVEDKFYIVAQTSRILGIYS